jgi:hypothetical protein
MINHSSLVLNKKTSLIFILLFTTIIVFDSSIVSFSTYSGVELPISINVMIFVSFSIIFVICSTMLLNSVRKIVSKYAYKPTPRVLRYFQYIIISTLILTCALILVIILQMLLLNSYSISLLVAQTYFTHFSALVFLSSLVFLFGRWFTSKRNYIILMYVISFFLASINIVVSFLYLESYLFSSSLPYANVFPVEAYVANFGALPFPESLSPVFDALSLSSFLFMWVAAAISLSQYRYKMGTIKYFSLMSIPLLYYIFPFQNYFGDALLSMLQSSPVFFSLIYVLIFSATKQVGALFFSLSFWTASTLVHDERIRNSLLISSLGIAIFYGSIAIAPLQFHVYPPYGLITEAFLPLGSYLLFIGIFTSAVHISRDSKVRNEFYKSASSQLTLLKDIGVSQMEKELESQANSIGKRAKLLESPEEPELKYEEIKAILHDVLNELYYSKGKKEKS